MRTISSIVEAIIAQSPFYAEAIAEGIVNNAEIARRIKPLVEKRLLEDVSEAAVSMALHRLEKTMKMPETTGILPRISDITVRSNLVEFVFPNAEDMFSVVDEVSRLARKRKDAFVNFSRGLYGSLLIVSKEFEKDAARAARRARAERVGGLSAITMRLPDECVEMPGVYYPLLKAIAWEGISFVEVMSIDTEFSIIFKDEDVDRAFSVLKRITAAATTSMLPSGVV